MMGLSRADAMEMSIWEYEARLWQWNEAHDSDGDKGGDVELPDPALVQRHIDMINSDPKLNPPG